jgi:hypothetical protein
MSGDIVQIAVGVFFLSWLWLFPEWLMRTRDRLSARGGDLEHFDARFGRRLILVGDYGVPALGLLLVGSGVVFLTAGA